jgi:hypothetical protein
MMVVGLVADEVISLHCQMSLYDLAISFSFFFLHVPLTL